MIRHRRKSGGTIELHDHNLLTETLLAIRIYSPDMGTINVLTDCVF